MNGANLLAVNKSRYFQKGSDLALGTGAFVTGLEYSADCKAEAVGKPSQRFFEIAAARFPGNIPLGEIMMVGDDIRDDVIGNNSFIKLRKNDFLTLQELKRQVLLVDLLKLVNTEMETS